MLDRCHVNSAEVARKNMVTLLQTVDADLRPPSSISQNEALSDRKKAAPPIAIASVMRAQGSTGMQTHFRTLLHLLHQNDHACNLITPFDAIPWHAYPMMGARKPIEFMSSSLGVWWYRRWHGHYLARQLKQYFQDNERCIIYAQCPPSAHAALSTRRSRHQVVVMAVHFNLSQADEWAEKKLIVMGGKLHQSICRFEKEILPQLDALVFVSDFMRQALLARIPEIRNVPSIVLPNFVPDPPVEKPEALHTDLITIGSLEPRKNQRYLLEIIAAAKKKGAMLGLSIVGDGPDRVMLEDYARQLKINDCVKFLGFVENAPQLLRHHRAYIHSATMENMPLTLIEAISYGVPVFAAPVGGIPEIFTDGVEGRMLSLFDADRSADIILEWISCPDKLFQAGQAARERFLSHYESNLIGQELIDFLDGMGRQARSD